MKSFGFFDRCLAGLNDCNIKALFHEVRYCWVGIACENAQYTDLEKFIGFILGNACWCKAGLSRKNMSNRLMHIDWAQEPLINNLSLYDKCYKKPFANADEHALSVKLISCFEKSYTTWLLLMFFPWTSVYMANSVKASFLKFIWNWVY